ncbi:B3/4 domain-containing protein [Thaumasiovibrio sp. DFM-14]|uniref:B3/B4 domain-containing protein n=1 Tax=Thaumasiovibrio sp. DFM-14 TaxID=3384792 RepID=UPI00399F41AB
MIETIKYNNELIDLCPELSVCCLSVDNISADVENNEIVGENISSAKIKLEKYKSESSIPSISLWRSAYRKVGIEPTKHRMAAESLLRRLRKSGDLPSHLHPLVVLCNSLSVKYHLPIAALDADNIDGNLVVSFTKGGESYTTFQGEEIVMPPEEVSFIDNNNVAHARKWSHKQNAISVITDNTSHALITIESLITFDHDSLRSLIEEITSSIKDMWPSSNVSYEVKCNHDLRNDTFDIFR